MPTKRKLNPYPYSIPPVTCPDDTTLQQLDAKNVLEFFRVEALLRSKPVMQLYQREGRSSKSDRTLQTRPYSLYYGWRVLNGKHHHLLVPEPSLSLHRAGIVELWKTLSDWDAMKECWKEFNPEFDYEDVFEDPRQDIESDDPRYLYIGIDAAHPPERIIGALRPILKQRHKAAKAQAGRPPSRIDFISIDPRKPRERPIIRNFKAWFDYLKCYDLRHCEGLSYGEIAKRVYPPGGPKARDRAEKAFIRVQRLIAAAESGNLPPQRI